MRFVGFLFIYLFINLYFLYASSSPDEDKHARFISHLITAEDPLEISSLEDQEILVKDKSYIRIALFSAAYRGKDEVYESLLVSALPLGLTNQDTRASFLLAATRVNTLELAESQQAILRYVLQRDKLKPSDKHLNVIAGYPAVYEKVNSILSEFSLSLPTFISGVDTSGSKLKVASKEGNLEKMQETLKMSPDIDKEDVCAALYFAVTKENEKKNNVLLIRELLSISEMNIRLTQADINETLFYPVIFKNSETYKKALKFLTDSTLPTTPSELCIKIASMLN